MVGAIAVPSSYSGSTSYLTNLSVRSNAGSGSQTLIAGFVVAGTGSEAVLLRGDGPTLSDFGVDGALSDPVLKLFNSSGTEIDSNSKWDGSALLDLIFSEVGAFALPSGSNDAALYESALPVGSYTAEVVSAGGSQGTALLEVYDADLVEQSARFTNLSARSEVGTGANGLVAGFVVAGTAYESVLIRGSGPALSPFGVTGVLANPQLTLYDSAGHVIASDTGWGSAPVSGDSTVQAAVAGSSAAIFARAGAFAFPSNSPDCALVATLPPGAYTAVVSGLGDTTGVALVEVYEIASEGSGGAGSPPAFIVQPFSQTIGPGGSYTFNVAASGASSLQWFLNGSVIPGATSPTYVATLAGTYDVVATNSFGSTTSNEAMITIGAGTAGVSDLASAAGQVYYVTFNENILEALGVLQQHLGIEVGFSWDSNGIINNSATSNAGPDGATFTTKANGMVAVGPGSGTKASTLRFEWIYNDSTGTLIAIYFDGVYFPPSAGQGTGTFAGIASIVYSTVSENAFADSGFVAAFEPEPPASTSF